ncbi:MAG: hypothetical protein DRN96_02980 [Thermoproteota archaeon]|nr:MAG: hypothetical protein DRN96_02980 [Candidatus Korarchaeota archaeon]
MKKPSIVYAPLGTRGFDPIRTDRCLECDSSDIAVGEARGWTEGNRVIEELPVECRSCGASYKLRYIGILDEGRRVATIVDVLSPEGEELGWLGVC